MRSLCDVILVSLSLTLSHPIGTYGRRGVCELCPPGTHSEMGAKECTPCGEHEYADSYGSAECKKCGQFLSSTPDRTDCDTHGCVFTFPFDKAIQYNLSSIDRIVSVRTNEKVSYKISLCSKLSALSQCYDANNKLMNNTHSCILDLSTGTSLSLSVCACVPLSLSPFPSPSFIFSSLLLISRFCRSWP